MSAGSLSKADRRQIADQFKDRKVPRGIFAIRCCASGDVWVGSSPNLDSARNSLWFQLRGGMSRHPSLQRAWGQFGEEAFVLEVLEQFEEETSTLLLADMYSARKKAWAGRLNGRML